MQLKKQQPIQTALSRRQRSMYLSEIKRKLILIKGVNRYQEEYFKQPVQIQVFAFGLSPTIVNLWAIVLTSSEDIMVSEGAENWYQLLNKPSDDKAILAVWQKMCELETAFKNDRLNKKTLRNDKSTKESDTTLPF